MLEDFYGGDRIAMAGAYYREVAAQAEFDEVDIIGHLDLLMKYNEDESFLRFDDPAYVNLAEECIYTIGTKKIFEVNTGAIARGTRKTPYPAKNLLEIMHSAGVKLMLNSDCHNRKYLDCAFDQSLKLIRSCGFDCLYILKDGEFIPVDIDRFH
jgi:histidinol-phosphatase (PHP family)